LFVALRRVLCTFQGLMGVFSIIVMWPGILILHFTGIETLEAPANSQMYWLLVLNVVLDISFNFFLLLGMSLSSPLFVSVGIMMVMPATVATDAFVHHVPITWGVACGCALIAVAFGLLNFTIRWPCFKKDVAAESSKDLKENEPS
jgi:solute carrier family 35 protein F5